ncbi:MAG: Hsp70 family protein [Oscillibacter sp.]|nr:Hsp70 family protein [Oscillibacter sp.]
MRRIGIDFGTCNIKGAEKKKNGAFAPLKLGKVVDKKHIPNVILYEEKEEKEEGVGCLLGKTALIKVAEENDRIRFIKRHLQEKDWKRELSFGKTVAVRDVTLDIMRCLYQAIRETSKEDDISTVITVPVNFSRRQSLIVRQAAEQAGFAVNSVITEPFAAFFFLMQEYLDDDEERHVLIFDLGGGTMDACLVSVTDSKQGRLIQTQAAAGISYGGNNVNEGIINKILSVKAPEIVRSILKAPPSPQIRRSNFYKLMEAIDDAKEELFSDDERDLEESAEVSVTPIGDSVKFIPLSGAEVYAMLDEERWESRIEKLLDRLFADSADLVPEDVTDIFVIGGTSSIPYFREKISGYFRKRRSGDTDALYEKNEGIDAEERIYHSVALGAAIYQDLLGENRFVIRDRIPFVIYTKDAKGRVRTRLTANDCWKEYSTPYAALSALDDAESVSVYQSLYAEEEEKEVYLGRFRLSEETKRDASLYRLAVDRDREIRIDYGAVPTGSDVGTVPIVGHDTLKIEL